METEAKQVRLWQIRYLIIHFFIDIMKKSCRRVRVERPNVPLPYTEFLIPRLGPDGLGLLLN